MSQCIYTMMRTPMSEFLKTREPAPQDRVPLEGFEPIATSARSNSEVDDEEIRSRFPVIAVLFVIAMSFILMSTRVGVITLSAGTVLLIALHRFYWRI
jgi:hypothetical protein